MLIADVNVLVYACSGAAFQHDAARTALADALDSVGGLGVSSVALSGLIRINLQARFRDTPSRIGIVLDFADALRAHPECRQVEPGEGHWPQFSTLLSAGRFGHRKTTDAWFAALAIEHDATLITFDGGFAQFEPFGLKWRHLKS